MREKSHEKMWPSQNKAFRSTCCSRKRWRDAASETRSREAIRGSLPHRSPEEQTAIVEGFLGVTTWQAIVAAFALDPAVLADTVDARESTAAE